MISFDEDKQKQKVAELLRKEEEEVMQALSQKFGLEYIDLSNTSIDGDALRLIDEQTSRDNKIAAFDLVDRKLKIAVRNPEDEQVKVIVKNLDSIQNFGAMDTLCTDKTGTITQGKVVLEKYLDFLDSKKLFFVSVENRVFAENQIINYH